MALFSSPATRRFMRYLAVGVSTFLFDLALLYLLVSVLSVPYYYATPLAFLVAVTLNYLASRRIVFHGTARSLSVGYANFLTIAFGGAALVTLGVTFLVSALALHYLIARTLVAGVVGMGNYLLNLYFNFKVVGHHPTKAILESNEH